MAFNVYSMSAGVVGTYNLVVKGTTQFFNQDASYNIMTFKVVVKCFTTIVRAKDPTLDFLFFLGEGGIEVIKFKEFEMWPVCGTEEQTVKYSGKLQTGEVLPSGVKVISNKQLVQFQDDGSLKAGDYIIYV
jgi:hypothetical protein